METKLDYGRILDVVRWKFDCWKVIHNFEEHEGGRIVILSNPSLIKVDIMGMNAHLINTYVTCLVSNRRLYVSFVYGLHSILARRPLWDSLYKFGRNGGQA